MLAKFNLRAAVRDAIERTKKRTDARDVLMRRAEKDLALRDALVQAGATFSVSNYYATERQAAFKMELVLKSPARFVDQYSPEVARRRMERNNRRQFWHRYTLFGSGSMSLADARRDDLMQSIGARKDLAQANMSNAAFEQSIARRMKDDNRTVARTLTASQVERLARQHLGQED